MVTFEQVIYAGRWALLLKALAILISLIIVVLYSRKVLKSIKKEIRREGLEKKKK
jgi:ABC-type antimicrobial peptide transport system permease subunit